MLVDRWYPSTQVCSTCGHKQPMNLKVRSFDCGACGFKVDRDLNASVNLEKYARKVKPCLDVDGSDSLVTG
ncbi:transposase [Microseira wollei]|uniref:transposase n=1 Tax=Microseira wollei TaxID=467598 RepID=UPI0021F58B81|nr:transposase [Microseira wollei]